MPPTKEVDICFNITYKFDWHPSTFKVLNQHNKTGMENKVDPFDYQYLNISYYCRLIKQIERKSLYFVEDFIPGWA